MTETRAFRLGLKLGAIPGVAFVASAISGTFRAIGRFFKFVEDTFDVVIFLVLIFGLPALGIWWLGRKIKASGYLDFLSVNRLTTNEAIIFGAVIIACAVMWTGALVIRSRNEK